MRVVGAFMTISASLYDVEYYLLKWYKVLDSGWEDLSLSLVNSICELF